MAADREGLREALAQALYAYDESARNRLAPMPWASETEARRRPYLARAEIAIAGPLAETLAQADTAAQAVAALEKINGIRNSIIGLQTLNWSEHVYPLVSALEDAGIRGMGYPEARENFGTTLQRAVAAEDAVARLSAEVERLRAALIGIAEQDRLGADDIYAGGGDDESVIAHLERRIESRLLIARTALAAGQDKEGGKPTDPTPQKDRDHG